MARPLRIDFAGALNHITSRGDRQEAIYENDEDREAFLTVMAETVDRYHWIRHAYCLMTNHYHLVMETVEGNLSQGMRHLNGDYTQASNRRHRRVGHLFQGRFKGILVDKDVYLLELSRYVVLNPVRAKIVDAPEQWPWSSYRAMIGTAPTPDWLAVDVTAHPGGRNAAILAAYATGAYTYREIAEYFSVHLATVGRIVRETMQRCEN